MKDLLELQQKYDDLRAAHERTLRNLAKQKVSKEELVEAVYVAAKDAAKALNLPKTPKPKAPKKSKNTPETAIAVLSDWQLAKITPSYNSQVCEERIELYGDKVIECASIQETDHPVRSLRVWLLGDLIEGEDIFPGQAHLIDASLYRQITVDGPRILCSFLRKMLTHFDEVHVVGVIGNHGRIGRKGVFAPETNGDRMLYKICEQILASETRLTWSIPDGMGERNWYAVDKVTPAYSALLCHGDQIRGGFGGFPFYGLAKKTWGWATGAIEEHFDEVVIGHWHQPTRVTLNRITARVNGSTESHNTYAQEQLAAVGRPSQWLLFAHPERGITAEYCLWLDQ